MSQRVKKMLFNSAILTISNFANKILSLILIALYTRVLSVNEYGIFDITITTINILIPILTINIYDSIMLFMLKNNDKDAIITIGLKYQIIGIIFFGILSLFCNLILKLRPFSYFYVLVFAYFVFYSFNQFLIHILRGYNQLLYIGTASLILAFFTLFFSYFFLIILNYGLKGFYLANIFSNLISTVYLVMVSINKNYFKLFCFDTKLEKKMLKYGMPLILVSLGWVLNDSIDKYMVTYFLGVGMSGILAIAYKIPNILNVFQSIFIQAWQISAIEEYISDDRVDYYSLMFEIISAIMCLICGTLIIFSKNILTFICSNEFILSYKYVPFLLVSALFNCASGILGPILSAEYNNRSLVKSAFFGIIINVLLNYILLNKIGLQGVTIATSASSFIIFLIRYFDSKNNINITHGTIISWIVLVILAISLSIKNVFLFQLICLLLLIIINFSSYKKIAHLIFKKLFKVF